MLWLKGRCEYRIEDERCRLPRDGHRYHIYWDRYVTLVQEHPQDQGPDRSPEQKT
jgi:hypothetical protein